MSASGIEISNILRQRRKFSCLLTRPSRYDGIGGWAKNSTRIPLKDAALYVGGTAFSIWSALGIARFIWG